MSRHCYSCFLAFHASFVGNEGCQFVNHVVIPLWSRLKYLDRLPPIFVQTLLIVREFLTDIGHPLTFHLSSPAEYNFYLASEIYKHPPDGMAQILVDMIIIPGQWVDHRL